ncbi:MAG TPA: hypothetical protein VFY93_08520 [Planctomycetota bacterium]|nr:hypothetical protein [Planctomycetota bacterium]
MNIQRHLLGAAAIILGLAAGCGESSARSNTGNNVAESCMRCHNASGDNDYSGPGIENPHPFPGADNLLCTTCHGGNPLGDTVETAHVPPPPEIGDRVFQDNNALAFFNRTTLAGIDKFPDYTVNGKTYTGIDYLQFINPGDLRVVTLGRACGQCHQGHAAAVASSPLATEVGIMSGAMFAAGMENRVAARRDVQEDTLADIGFRDVQDTVFDPNVTGAVASLAEFPVYSARGDTSGVFRNNAYNANALPAGLDAQGRAVLGSPLANLYHEMVAFTCGDCHLGSAGANNRYADFRSSGCTACHMRYSLDGRSGSLDLNVPKDEPANPDAINDGERSHVMAHKIASKAQTLSNGVTIQGIDDYACVGCHQGSNRMVLQYWGIRLDQNQDLRNRLQYPANPVTFRNTARDERLFDNQVDNNTFNGRNANQYILEEDYDGDGRDDTPEDVHYEAGMGCIDCHGSFDLHGDTANPTIMSRMEQHVAIQCENCHGTVAAYATTVSGTDAAGQPADFAVDGAGNRLNHVVREADGRYYLTSRLDGRRHFVPQTRDVVVDTGATNPFDGQTLYNAKASYAMGRDDDTDTNGIGPKQAGRASTGFAHSDSMDCASCHSSWSNSCIGCHLKLDYDEGNNFSNITGERIVVRQANADFTYQSPVYFLLGLNTRHKVTQVASNTKVFFQWFDRNNDASQIFAFTDRNGLGNDPNTPFPALGCNAEMQHSIRGHVTSTQEGPRYCVACHLTTEGMTNYGTLYEEFRTNMANNRFDLLNFNTLRQHFGQNPGNQLNSPLWVHMVAGLGSGIWLFNKDGGPLNPLDNNDNRVGSNGVSPADQFGTVPVRFNLDKIVDANGREAASSNHTFIGPGPGPSLRDGSTNPNLIGPLGKTLIEKLTDPTAGVVLDSWLDANGQPHGTAAPGGN